MSIVSICTGGPTSSILQEVEVEAFPSSVCQMSYSTFTDFDTTFPEGLNADNTLCAGDLSGGKDACQVRNKIVLIGFSGLIHNNL